MVVLYGLDGCKDFVLDLRILIFSGIEQLTICAVNWFVVLITRWETFVIGKKRIEYICCDPFA